VRQLCGITRSLIAASYRVGFQYSLRYKRVSLMEDSVCYVTEREDRVKSEGKTQERKGKKKKKI